MKGDIWILGIIFVMSEGEETGTNVLIATFRGQRGTK